jgi:predicted transcriptional regulator
MRENKSVNITFRVTSDFKKKLAEFCEEGDLSNSFVIRQALAFYMKRQIEAGSDRLNHGAGINEARASARK